MGRHAYGTDHALVEPVAQITAEQLPEHLRTGTEFFRHALEHGLIVVPGRFFDINPGQRRPDRPSRFQRFARFSFGPELDVVERGLEKLAAMLRA